MPNRGAASLQNCVRAQRSQKCRPTLAPVREGPGASDHHNGQLDREHFGRAMAALGLGFSRAEVDNLFLTYDFDGTGVCMRAWGGARVRVCATVYEWA